MSQHIAQPVGAAGRLHHITYMMDSREDVLRAGPTVVIEYAPQRGVDHVHTIYRDPTNDYGAAYERQ